MTYLKENTERMLKLKRSEAERKKTDILNVIKELKESTPNQICKYLTNANEISNNKTMSMRTILRKLNELETEGLIEEHNHKYSLTNLALHDIRYFNRDYAKQFGSNSLLEIMSNHIPSNNLENNLQKLIEIFGIYVVNLMIEALRPLDSNIKIKNQLPSTAIARDILVENWILDSFNPVLMLQLFLLGINDQQKFNKSISVDKEWFFTFTNKKLIEESHQTNYQYSSYYSIEPHTYNKVIKFLNKKYPTHYRRLFQTKADFYGRPKEFSLNNVREKINS